MRKLFAVVVGVVVANLLVYASEMWLLPQLPFGRAYTPSEFQQADFVAGVPLAAKWWVVTGWFLGPLVGAVAAFRIGRSDWTGWVVGGIIGALCVVNVIVLPHPLWMRLAAVAAPFAGALFAFGLYRRWRAAHLHLRRPAA